VDRSVRRPRRGRHDGGPARGIDDLEGYDGGSAPDEEMSKGDLLVERGATKLQQLARKAAGRGDGVGEWLSEELRADAEFLRKLKPSLIAARARGENASEPGQPTAEEPRDYAAPPPPPQPPPPPPPPPKAKARKKRKTKSGGPSPILVVGAALVAGIVAAKVIDWRGHAHPRD
jgi:hypothetical protein